MRLIGLCLQEKKKIGLMKDELGGMIMKEFIAPTPKICAYLMDNDNEIKKAKEQRNV